VDGFLYVLHSDGRLKWKLNTLAIREGSAVLGTNGMIFQASGDGLWAINADGKRIGYRGKDDMDGTAAVTADGGVNFLFRGVSLCTMTMSNGLAGRITCIRVARSLPRLPIRARSTYWARPINLSRSMARRHWRGRRGRNSEAMPGTRAI